MKENIKDYKNRILDFLSDVDKPTDVEKIRIHCDIKNWNTALKHCLELFIEEQISGKKTSKSWVFWGLENDKI
jgi:hypothetical protein